MEQIRPNPEKIHSMFSAIATSYDKANTVMSLGIHHLWRRRLVRLSGVQAGQKVLDCATGTGDLAIEFKKVVGPAGDVTGTDFCSEMLKPAPAKAQLKGLKIRFEQADVLKLPYSDQSFDISSIAFGIRNVSDPLKGLSELARVVKPGGRVMVLEFGQPTWPVVGPLYHFYSERILPRVGGWITGEKKAYEYLQESSARFPCRESFLELMKQTGRFSELQYYPLSGGIAYIYKGRVL